MTDKAEQIARSLTEAQRERLLGAENTGMPAGIAAPLIERGLIDRHPFDTQGWIWSDLGLAVREILRRQA